jgi:DNA-binding CsgD family transcriptional regulator
MERSTCVPVANAITEAGLRASNQPGNVRRPQALLTPAESNVLALLPTHLSLEAIGQRLGRKRSTVKTHVEDIYKKLGARTRAEAIERAREAGLLGPEPGSVR